MDTRPLVKLDLGCGRRKPEGFVGIDISPDVGADLVFDIGGAFGLPQRWPLEDASVEKARAHHFFEHLWPSERAHVMRELERVLVSHGTFEITTPLGYNRQLQDPDHKWPPVVRSTYNYYSRVWRDANELSHYEKTLGLTMDFVIAAESMLFDPEQYKGASPQELERLLRTDPDAQTDLFVILRKVA